MKKYIAVLLSFVLCLMAGASAFAEPPESDPAKWERHADELERDGQYEQAAEAYKKAGDLFVEYSEDVMRSRAVFSYRRAAEIFEDIDMHKDACECCLLGGDAAMLAGKYSEAELLYDDARDCAEEISDRTLMAEAMGKEGDAQSELGKYDSAAKSYGSAKSYLEPDTEAYAEIAVKYAKTLEKVKDDEVRIADAYKDAFNAVYTQGDIDYSMELLKIAVELYIKSDMEKEASNLFSSAIFQLYLDNRTDYASALCLDFYEYFGSGEMTEPFLKNIALPYYEENGDDKNIAYTLELLGNCRKAAGENSEARDFYLDASEYYRRADCPDDASRLKDMAGSCSAFGSIFSEGNVIVLAVIVIAAAAVGVVLAKKKKMQ